MVYGRRDKYKYYFKIFKEMAIIIQLNKNYNKIDYRIRLSQKTSQLSLSVPIIACFDIIIIYNYVI